MKFFELINLIKLRSESKNYSFDENVKLIEDIVFKLDKISLLDLIEQVGIIPEDIEHDSSEEKLYSKLTDIILSKSFQELGIKSEVSKKRSNCADVICKSIIYNYSFVADAKSFRLSRTAKNQKDFKVKSMNDWRGEHNYAILVCPYYQYPKQSSQIYGQALDSNVCLFSWEQLYILLKKNIIENEKCNLDLIWNYTKKFSNNIKVSDKNINFIQNLNDYISKNFNISILEINNFFNNYKIIIKNRSKLEVDFLEKRADNIKNYTKERAIKELIKSLKINEKINSINKYVKALENE